jgi:hypothetical protein
MHFKLIYFIPKMFYKFSNYFRLLLSLHILNDFVKPAILCHPILSRTFKVTVEHCDGLNVVFVRSLTDKPNFNILIDDITAYFETDGMFLLLFI